MTLCYAPGPEETKMDQFIRQTEAMTEQIINELVTAQRSSEITMQCRHIEQAKSQLEDLYDLVWHAEVKGVGR